jgi:hypothetical protein
MSDVRLYVRDSSAVILRQFTASGTLISTLALERLCGGDNCRQVWPSGLTGACTDALLDEPLLHGIARQ